MVKDQPEQPRINNIQNLLQVAIQNHEPNNEQSSSLEQISEERRRFFESAIREITVDHAEILKKQIEELNGLIVKLNSKTPLSEEETEEYCKLLEEDLVENVSNIDFANDFYKLGGFKALTELINCELSTFKAPVMMLIGELVQNNDFCQKASYELNYLSKFMNLIKKEENQTIVLKTIYALSCLLRGNEKILDEFLKTEENIRILLNTMVKFNTNEKIVFKISFLLNSICGLKQSLYEQLSRLGFVVSAINIIKNNVETTHEYLLAILVGMCENDDRSKLDCVKNGHLKLIVQDKIKFFKDKDEFLEEMDYCKKLLAIYDIKRK